MSILSFVFVILSYYIITNPLFLSFEDTGELLLYVMLIICSIYLIIQSIIELVSFKKKIFILNITNMFCFISSLMFLLASIYAVLFV